MNEEEIKDLERQVHEKADELRAKLDLMERYAQSIGRDRWYNRGCHDITTLRGELNALRANLKSASSA